jgi:hypothetical protein
MDPPKPKQPPAAVVAAPAAGQGGWPPITSTGQAPGPSPSGWGMNPLLPPVLPSWSLQLHTNTFCSCNAPKGSVPTTSPHHGSPHDTGKQTDTHTHYSEGGASASWNTLLHTTASGARPPACLLLLRRHTRAIQHPSTAAVGTVPAAGKAQLHAAPQAAAIHGAAGPLLWLLLWPSLLLPVRRLGFSWSAAQRKQGRRWG